MFSKCIRNNTRNKFPTDGLLPDIDWSEGPILHTHFSIQCLFLIKIFLEFLAKLKKMLKDFKY